MNICAVDRAVLETAAALEGTDFEDDIQVACAISLELEIIVTRDNSGFSASPIATMSPEELKNSVQRQSDGNPLTVPQQGSDS